jgi:hypothetical protein
MLEKPSRLCLNSNTFFNQTIENPRISLLKISVYFQFSVWDEHVNIYISNLLINMDLTKIFRINAIPQMAATVRKIMDRHMLFLILSSSFFPSKFLGMYQHFCIFQALFLGTSNTVIRWLH